MQWKRAEQVLGVQSQTRAESSGGELGAGLKPGGCRDSMCLVEWKSGRGLNMTHGSAKFKG